MRHATMVAMARLHARQVPPEPARPVVAGEHVGPGSIWGRALRPRPPAFDRAAEGAAFDAVIARYATRVNGVTDFFLTKLDVLSGLERIPVCVAYDVDGQRHDEIPMTQTDFHHAKPVYEYLPGWDEDISKAQSFSDLPPNAQAYVRRLEELSGAPISAIGVGPDRNATIEIRSFL